MAKRRKRNNSPDLPKATLARARKQAQGDAAEPEPDEAEPVEEESSQASIKNEPAAKQRRSRRRATPQPIQFGEQTRRKSGEATLDSAVIADRLAHPTVFVTEEQLHEEYGFVVTDIRNMFMLTGILIIVLVVLAQFI